MNSVLSLSCWFLLGIHFSEQSYFTIEIKDKEVQCFFLPSRVDDKVVLEYQVISGGNYDIDVVLRDPSKQSIFSKEKSSYETVQYKVNVTGDYEMCLSNLMSSIAHKTVFVYWEAVNEDVLRGSDPKRISPNTLLESVSDNIHESLRNVQRYQTHSRNSEAADRMLGESLNELVLMWSIIQAMVVLTVGFGQVWVLKSFFADNKTIRRPVPPRL
jgi:p24 family protein gamma-3